jgi:photosystem II stability/assembly factor-like uncharacterized protein
LFRTEDGGRSWKKETGDFHQVTGVWVSEDGKESRVLSTPRHSSEGEHTFWFLNARGGQVWTEVRAAYIDHPRAAFLNGNAIVAGKDGIFYKPDGASPLKRVFDGDWHGIAFAAGAQIGLAVGESGRAVRSEDGGKTWLTVHEWKGTGDCRRIALQPTTGRVWAVGEKVFRSDETGLSFRELPIPGVPAETGVVLDIKFSKDGRTGWMTTKKGVILRTTDGGESWVPAEMSHPNGSEVASVAFDPAAEFGMALGPGMI